MSSEVFSTTHILIVAAISGVLGGAERVKRLETVGV